MLNGNTTSPFSSGLLQGVWCSYLRSMGSLPFDTSVPAPLTIQMLEDRFGVKRVARVIHRYGFERARLQQERFTFGHFVALLIGIAVQVRYCDLREKTTEVYGAGRSFLRLSGNAQRHVMRHFRPEALIVNIMRAYHHYPIPQKNARLKKDIKILKACSLAERFIHPGDQSLALSEFLAHELVYKDLQEGMILPVPTPVGGRPYQRVQQTYYSHPQRPSGLVAFFLRPLCIDNQEHLHVMFRGRHNWKSTKRLLDRAGPGRHSYQRHAHGLLATFARALPESTRNRPIHFDVHGHSLGAADSMRFLCSVIQHYSPVHSGLQTMLTHLWQRLKHATLHLWNAAGISHQENARFLKQLSKASPHLAVHNHYVVGDLVQASGEVVLGAGPAHPMVERHAHEYRYADVIGSYNPLWRQQAAHTRQHSLPRKTLPGYSHFTEQGDPQRIHSIFRTDAFIRYKQRRQ